LFLVLDPYSNLDHKQISPVLVAFEQELSRFIKYIKKKSEPGLKIKKNDEEPLARGYEYFKNTNKQQKAFEQLANFLNAQL